MTTKKGSKTTTKQTKTKSRKKPIIKESIAERVMEIDKEIKKDLKNIEKESEGIEMGKKDGNAKPVPFKRSDSIFTNAVAAIPVATHKGVVSEISKLERELEIQKAFSEKAIKYFKENITEKNQMIDNLKEENTTLRKQTEMLHTKIKKNEELVDKLFLKHIKDEELTEEDKSRKFIDNVKNLWT